MAGGWPANGGHHQGRKLPILFAGELLNDEHMKNAGKWKTRFQDDEQTFIVSQADVEISNSSKWAPDKRGGEPQPYTAADIGTPEWGIRHADKPENDNKLWTTVYRNINNASIVAVVLNARIMGLEEAWNHPALFAYADRITKGENLNDGSNSPSAFVMAMWKTRPRNPDFDLRFLLHSRPRGRKWPTLASNVLKAPETPGCYVSKKAYKIQKNQWPEAIAPCRLTASCSSCPIRCGGRTACSSSARSSRRSSPFQPTFGTTVLMYFKSPFCPLLHRLGTEYYARLPSALSPTSRFRPGGR